MAQQSHERKRMFEKSVRGSKKFLSVKILKTSTLTELNMSKVYPSDLSRREYKLIKEIIPEPKPGGRPRTVDLWKVLNAIQTSSKVAN